MSENQEITRERVVELLFEDRALAKEKGKVSDVIATTKLIGDTIGVFKFDVEHSGNITHTLQNFNNDDIKSLLVISSQLKGKMDD